MIDLNQDPAARELARYADAGVARYSRTLEAVAAPAGALESTGFETGEQLAAEVRKLRAGVASLGASGGPGYGGGGSDGTDAPGDGPTDYGDLGDPFVPGDASTPGASVTAEVRTRGGTASLIGHSEFTSPNTPPEKYLVKTLSGATVGRTYEDGACTDLICTATDTYSGTISYDAITGVLTEAGQVTRSGDCPTGNGTTSATSIGVFASGGDVEVLARLTRTITNDGACRAAVGTISFNRPGSPTSKEELSDEDTDENAVARLVATAPTWSSFSACGAYPCGSATWAARTSGFTFAYGEAELRLTFAGMPAGWLFSAKVTLTRVSAATSEVSVVEVQTYEATPDGSGDAEITVSVEPEEPGYTYRVEKVVFVR